MTALQAGSFLANSGLLLFFVVQYWYELTSTILIQHMSSPSSLACDRMRQCLQATRLKVVNLLRLLKESP